jgi:hypothetical protein
MTRSTIRWAFACSAVIIMLLYPLEKGYAQCTSSGAHSTGTVSNVPFSGSDFAFHDLGYATASDNNRATASGLASILTGHTDYLQATNFNFSIPPEAIICGIEVRIEKSAWGIGSVLGIGLASVRDHRVHLVSNGAIIGANKAKTGNWTDTDAYHTYGGSTDLWDTYLTPATVNAPDFGVAISATISGLIMLIPSVRIDHVQIIVHYYIGVLPARIQKFSAVRQGNKVSIQAEVVNVKESDQPFVQRSKDGVHWENVSAPLKPIADGPIHRLQTDDDNPFAGRSFYRLKISAKDGREVYSKPVLVYAENASQPALFPNPASDHIYVSMTNAQTPPLVTDACGKVVHLPSTIVNASLRKLHLEGLRPGLYFIYADNRVLKFLKKE